METKLSYHSVAPYLLNLQICGYYQIDPKSRKLHRVLHTIYMRFSFIWIIIYTALQAIKVYKEKKDIKKLIESLFLFLTHTDSIYKQTVLWLKSDKIEQLFETMRGPLFNQEESGHKVHLLATHRQGNVILRIFNGMCLITCFLWVLYPLLLHLQEQPVDFGIWLPYDFRSTPLYQRINVQSPHRFYITWLYVWVTTSSLALSNSTMDVMIAFLMDQCKTQIRILRDDLTNLVHKSKIEVKKNPNNFLGTVIEKRFKNILKHYIETLNFAEKVNDIFAGAIFYQLLVCAMIICTSVYRIVDISPGSIEFISMALYICCMLIESFLYCYYGNEITRESDKLAESAYAMHWYETSHSHRKCLIIFLERAKHSIKPVVGGVVPLSNNTFIKIVKSSYSLYTILQSRSD